MTFFTRMWQEITGYIFLCVSLLAMTGSVQAATKPRSAMEYFFHASFNDLREEASQARQEGKLGIFVMFSDPDCPWCNKMKATILNQPPLQDYYRKHFRVLHLDTRGDADMVNFDGRELSEKDFAFKLHRVRATPVFMIFDTQGKELLRYTGTARTANEFRLLADYVISGAYKKTNFTRFKRERLAGVVAP